MTDGFNLGNAYGSVTIDASGVDAGINAARSAMETFFNGVGGTFQRIGQGLTSAGAQISMMSIPIAAVGKVGLDAAADYETLMNQIKVFGGVGETELSKISQLAIQMGADTQFSANDAAAAYLRLLKSGQSVESAMAMLPQVMGLATVGSMSLADASGVVTAALAQFKLKGTDASLVVNALAKAANASLADVADLGQALQNVGPVAAQFGLSVDDTAAILAVFSNNGIQGSEAGTQLKSMLLNLSRPTDDVKGAFQQLGVSMYDSNGNVRDFNTVLVELDTALDALPVQQQNELMQTLAGAYGIVGFNALRASGGIDDMREAMEAAPDAMTVANELMKGFAGNVESLKGSIETLMIQALTPFMQNVLQPLVLQLIDVVNGLTAWAQANPDLMQKIAGVLAIVAALGPGLLVAGKAFELVGSSVKLMGTALSALTSPIGLAIALAAGLAYAYVNNLGGLKDFVDTEVRPVVEQFIGTLAGIWERVQPALEALGNWFVNDSLPAVAGFIQNVFIPALQWLMQAIGDVWTVVQPYLASFADWFTTSALPAVVSFITDTVIPAMHRLGEIIGYIWTDAQPYLAALGDWFVSSGLPSVIGFIRDVATWAIQGFINLLSGAWGIIQPLIQPLADWFSAPGGLGIMLNYASTTATAILNAFFGILQDAWNVIEPLIAPLATWFSENGGLGGALLYASGTATQILNGFFDVLEGAWAFIQPVLQSIADWFSDMGGLGGILTYASGTATVILNGFFDILEGAWAVIQPMLQPLADWFSDVGGLGGALNYIGGVFTTGFNAFTTLISSVWNAVSSGIATFKTQLDAAFLWVETEVITPIKTAVQSVIDTITGIWNSISAGVATFKTQLYSAFGWIVTDVINPVKQAIQDTIDKFNQLLGLLNVGGQKNNLGEDFANGLDFGGARATGGTVQANSTYLVGEVGPELFVPSSSGTIIPNNILGGLGGGNGMSSGSTTNQYYTITVTPQINPYAGDVGEQADQFASQLLLRLQTS